jgi:ERCC4-related helicase
MRLQQLFDDCFGVLFQHTTLSEKEIECLKHDLVHAWIKVTGRRIEPLLSPFEKEKISALMLQAEQHEGLAHAKLEALFMPVVSSLERYNEIMEIVFAEARELIEKLFKVFSREATQEQIFHVKETLKKYERVLHVTD